MSPESLQRYGVRYSLKEYYGRRLIPFGLAPDFGTISIKGDRIVTLPTTLATAEEFLADRMNVIKPSPSMAAKRKVDQLRAEGKTITDFTIGEPDLNTPEHIANAGIEAIQRGETKYTSSAGIPALLDAIEAKYRRENGLAFQRDQLVVGTGAKQLIFSALQATLNEGDEVIIPAPFWVSYPDMVLLNAGTPVICSSSEETGFKLTAEQLRAAITPRTKWVLLNAPNNPSGSAYDSSELEEILKIIEQNPCAADGGRNIRALQFTRPTCPHCKSCRLLRIAYCSSMASPRRTP